MATPKDDDGGVRKGAVWILSLKRDGSCKGFRKISDVGGACGLQFAGEFGSAFAGLGDASVKAKQKINESGFSQGASGPLKWLLRFVPGL